MKYNAFIVPPGTVFTNVVDMVVCPFEEIINKLDDLDAYQCEEIQQFSATDTERLGRMAAIRARRAK